MQRAFWRGAGAGCLNRKGPAGIVPGHHDNPGDGS